MNDETDELEPTDDEVESVNIPRRPVKRARIPDTPDLRSVNEVTPSPSKPVTQVEPSPVSRFYWFRIWSINNSRTMISFGSKGTSRPLSRLHLKWVILL